MKVKLTHLPFNSQFDPVSSPLEFIHADLVGPILPSSNGGARYFFTLVDQFYGYIDITILKEKSGTLKAIENFKKFFEKKKSHSVKMC